MLGQPMLCSRRAAQLARCVTPCIRAAAQAFAAAEAAYSRAMSAVAKLSLSSEADGPSLRAAMARASDLPDLMGLAHSSVSVQETLLAGLCTAEVRPLQAWHLGGWG